MQEDLLASCATASAHIAAWSNRSGKRSAGEHPSQAAVSSVPDRAAGIQSSAQDAVGAGMQLKVRSNVNIALNKGTLHPLLPAAPEDIVMHIRCVTMQLTDHFSQCALKPQAVAGQYSEWWPCVQSPRQSGREGDIPDSISQVCLASPVGAPDCTAAVKPANSPQP